MKKTMTISLALTLCLLAGCSAVEPTATAPATTAPATTAPPATTEAPTTTAAVETEAAEETAKIYIGSGDSYVEYATQIPQCAFGDPDETNAFLESLVGEIGALTGWDMSCSISSYKSVGVVLLPSNVIFSSPNEPQKEEFHMYEQTQLVETVLGSIQETVQRNLVSGEGDPDSVEVYFSTEDEQSLTFPESGVYVPMDEAYAGLVPIED